MNGRALHPETVIAQGPAGFAPQVEVARVGGGQLGLTPDGRWTFRLRPPRRADDCHVPSARPSAVN